MCWMMKHIAKHFHVIKRHLKSSRNWREHTKHNRNQKPAKGHSFKHFFWLKQRDDSVATLHQEWLSCSKSARSFVLWRRVPPPLLGAAYILASNNMHHTDIYIYIIYPKNLSSKHAGRLKGSCFLVEHWQVSAQHLIATLMRRGYEASGVHTKHRWALP